MIPLLWSRRELESRWERLRQPAQSFLLAHHEDLFLARRLHECGMPGGANRLVMEVRCVTAEPGQKLMIGVLETENLALTPGCAGVAVAIDPETGAIEDLHNNEGIIGYVTSAPMEAGVAVRLMIEAIFYDRVVIPRIWVGGECVLHPAFLIDPGRRLTGLAGGDVTNGAAPLFEGSSMRLEPVDGPLPMHG